MSRDFLNFMNDEQKKQYARAVEQHEIYIAGNRLGAIAANIWLLSGGTATLLATLGIAGVMASVLGGAIMVLSGLLLFTALVMGNKPKEKDEAEIVERIRNGEFRRRGLIGRFVLGLAGAVYASNGVMAIPYHIAGKPIAKAIGQAFDSVFSRKPQEKVEANARTSRSRLQGPEKTGGAPAEDERKPLPRLRASTAAPPPTHMPPQP